MCERVGDPKQRQLSAAEMALFVRLLEGVFADQEKGTVEIGATYDNLLAEERRFKDEQVLQAVVGQLPLCGECPLRKGTPLRIPVWCGLRLDCPVF